MNIRLDKAIEHAITERRIVGTVVIAAKGEQIIYQRAAGMADRETGRIMTEDTIFRLSSVTKPLVAAATLSLIELGLINLEDPVSRWLPDFKPHTADGTTPIITIRHLLNHTAGLSYGFTQPENGPYQQAQISDGLDRPGLSLEENLKRIISVPLGYLPGTGWSYSVGYDVLGGILSSATGQSLPQIIKQQVTDPLAMSDTSFDVTDRSRLATPYIDSQPEPQRMSDPAIVPMGDGVCRFSPERAFDKRSFASGGAGMLGTAGDFMRFLLSLRQGGSPILQPTSVLEMMRNQVGNHMQNQMPGWGFGYGGSVLIDPVIAQTPQSAGTMAWGGVYGHSWFIDPSRELTVVILTNTAMEGLSGQFPVDIRDALYSSE